MCVFDKINKEKRDHAIDQGYLRTRYHNMNFKSLFFSTRSKSLDILTAIHGNCNILLTIVLSCYTMVINTDFKSIFFEASFITVLLAGVQLSILNSLSYQKSMSHLFYIVGTDFYKYEGEGDTLDEVKNNTKFKVYIRKLVKVYSYLIFFTILFYLLLTPLIQSIEEDSLKGARINKKLPLLIYFPPETDHSLVAYLFASCVLFITGFYAYVGVIGLDLGCYTMILYLEHQQCILNSKVKALEVRAMSRMGLIKESTIEKYKGRLWNDKKFKKNMWLCLRENIKHHQIILKFYTLVQTAHKNNYLIVMGNGSILIGIVGYLLTKNPSITLIIKALVILSTVLIHVFMYCMYGQMVTDRSSELMNILYDCPWYQCDRNFKVSILIMMSMAKKPLELKSNFLKHPLTLQTFNDVVRLSYQFLNLISQT